MAQIAISPQQNKCLELETICVNTDLPGETSKKALKTNESWTGYVESCCRTNDQVILQLQLPFKFNDSRYLTNNKKFSQVLSNTYHLSKKSG